jgi:endonuclease/exonuclease/phosphatase family metal-dependent hydrolase
MLHVGTFNIRGDTPVDGPQQWEFRRDRLLQLIRDWSPDLLGLQEPFFPQLTDILRGLPLYDWVGCGRDDGHEQGEFCPILYRRERLAVAESGTFWLSEAPDTAGSKGWGSRYPRICTWARFVDRETGAAFFHYNLHLDHESQSARENGMLLLLERIRLRGSADAVLVTGDFNAGPNNPALALLRAPSSPAARDTYLEIHKHESSIGTFHGFTGVAREDRIDYIFVSPSWQVFDARILQGDGKRPFPSDHFPVTATLLLSVG